MNSMEPLQAQISPDSALMFEQLAIIEQTDRFKFINEALALGLSCADIVLGNNANGHNTNLYLETTPEVFQCIPLGFEPPEPDPRKVTPMPDDFPVLDPFADDDALNLTFQNETALRIHEVSEKLGISVPDFVDYSLYLRWRWGITKSLGGRVLVNSGDVPPLNTES